MKKRLFCILIIAILFTGCFQSSKQLLPFSSEHKVLGYNLPDNGSVACAQSFAENLGVVPVDVESKKDANMTSLSSIMVDVTTKDIIYQNNVYQRIYPASITKIFTAYVVLKYANPTDIVTVSKNAASITEPGAKLCGFKTGDKIKLETLLTAFLVYSGNDAGVALAEHVSGSVASFCELMNKEIKKIGAVDTHFVNPHGLHNDNHYTTAYDIYLVFDQLIKNDSFIGIINHAKYTATYNDAKGKVVKKTFKNTNRYLSGKAATPNGLVIVGGKTGTTNKAGSCLVLYSKGNNKHKYISLVLKANSADDLYNQMTYLLKLRK